MQAVILAAGKGTRLRPLTNTTPKGLIEIRGEPMLQLIFEALPDDVDEIILVVGYLGDQIKKHFSSTWNGKPIRYVEQNPLDGTGAALVFARPFLQGKFLVINGDDVYAKEDLTKLISYPLSILIQSTENLLEHSAIISVDHQFLGLEPYAKPKQTQWRVCGAYVLDERFFSYSLVEIKTHNHAEFSLPHTLVEFSKDVFVHAEEATYWRPVGTPEELEHIRSERT